MSHDEPLRQHLRDLLTWENAHAGYDAVVKNVPRDKRGIVPPGQVHSIWQHVEHMRLTQWDILDFSANPAYIGLGSVEAHWPKTEAPSDDAAWDASLDGFRRDRDTVLKMIGDPSVDLFERIPHGTGQTFLREVLTIADHTSYHVSQVVLARRALGIWPPA